MEEWNANLQRMTALLVKRGNEKSFRENMVNEKSQINDFGSVLCSYYIALTFDCALEIKNS
jgi:hypothetical protein